MINEEICSSFYGILYIKHWVFTGNYYIFVSNKIDRHNEQVEIEYPGVWKLSDEYDNRNSSYMEFLHQKNSLSILKNVYKELEKAELYREYSRQILSYHEYFRGNENLHLDHIMTKRKMDILQI